MKLSVALIFLIVFSVSAKTYHKFGNERDPYHHVLKQRATPAAENPEETATFWQNNAINTLNQRLERRESLHVAKNVILFIGDGMSIATLAAARTHLGQRNHTHGEETFLSFENFPYTGLSKTYCVDRQVADSACSATAYLCGVKANEATLGVTAAVKLSDCKAMNDEKNHVQSIVRLSQLAGKRTGIVTTTRVTHASPSGGYAHIANRDWEADTDVLGSKQDPKKCLDIAHQLVHGETGKNLNVIFGGGKYNFLPNNETDEENNPGWRNDSRNLINEWKELKVNNTSQYIYNLEQLKALNVNTEYVLGLFNNDHMPYNLDRDNKTKPSLKEMTEKAIELLSKHEKGFFLFVEGGRIDHAHHETLARKSLDETIELHKAVEAAVAMTNKEDTLIVVTSDHSHTMTINGYPSRGNEILGIGGMGNDSLPYTTLSYANGPAGIKGSRPNITEDDFEDPNYPYPSLVPLESETHGGEDVGIFASGPWAHLFTGTIEQNVIPHILSYASCVGNFSECSHTRNASSTVANISLLTVFVLLAAILQRQFLI